MGPRLLARAFRHELVSAIRGSLAGTEALDVSLAPVQPGDLIHGTFREVRINGKGFTTREGLRYDRIDFYSQAVQVDPASLFWRHELIWRRWGRTRLRVRLGEDSLTDWLRIKLPSVKPKVILNSGALRLEGRVNLQWTVLNFSANGGLQRKSESSLIYYPQSLSIGGFSLPQKWFKEKLQKKLGGWEIPLELPFPLELASFQIDKRALYAEWREPDSVLN